MKPIAAGHYFFWENFCCICKSETELINNQNLPEEFITLWQNEEEYFAR